MIQRLVHRDRVVATRISTSELVRWHRIATDAGLSLSELVRESVRHYTRQLTRDLARDEEPAA